MGRKEMSIGVLFVEFVTMIWLAGCAGLPIPTRSEYVSTEGLLGNCADFFASQDQEIVAAKVLDPGAFRIEGFPYLRTDRFLASFGKEVYDPEAFSDWLDRLQMMDQKARQHEIANLPYSNANRTNSKALNERVVDCGNLLRNAEFQNSKTRQTLRKIIFAPDEYIGTRRFFGIYPIAKWFVLHGVSKWHEEARKTFSFEPPATWEKVFRYSSPVLEELPTSEHIISSTPKDALGIPKYTGKALETLFAIHAPVWEIENQSDDDKIGSPVWNEKNELKINLNEPVTYTHLSFSRFGPNILTQLNYIIWFPARSKSGHFDIYAGKLDGINYRVTLSMDGTPILYETIHNCGCYYKAYPSSRLKLKSHIDYAEPPLILKAPYIDCSKETMVVGINSATHYVQHLYSRPKFMRPEKTYTLKPYDKLRSLPLAQIGRRSMFRQDGLAHDSMRSERFILWPSGVLSAGAMRQWGRHAVALVGKRHFDDPFYMEKMFKKNSLSKKTVH